MRERERERKFIAMREKPREKRRHAGTFFVPLRRKSKEFLKLNSIKGTRGRTRERERKKEFHYLRYVRAVCAKK
jgi:hypothetical protein